MFNYRLAALLGIPVADLLPKLSHDEYLGWMAYYQLEPWGCSVEDHRIGVVVAQMINMFVKGQTVRPTDIFPPRSEKARQELIWNQVDSVMSKLPNVEYKTEAH